MNIQSQPKHSPDAQELQVHQATQTRMLGGISIPELKSNPYPHYRKMRDTNPVHYDEQNKWWDVYHYDDVLNVVTDYTTFSSERVVGDLKPQGDSSQKPDTEAPARTILNTDPPRHRQMRSLITQAFTPHAIAQLAPRITSIVNDHLDMVAATGKMDVVRDLSYPLPTIVIAELLGIPISEREQFKRWSDAVVSTSQEEGQQAFKEMREYFKGIIAQRRIQPQTQDDLIKSLITAQEEGQHLTDAEVISFCVLLLIAGNETTTNLIGNAIICFDERPEVMDQLRNDPALILSAVEEVLRYLSPVQLLVRVATVDTEIGGKKIKAGEIIVPWLGSANRDERQFPHPDTFDIKRNPNRHVAFGHGIHFCIGAPLARLESKIALEAMLKRFQQIRRVPGVPLKLVDSTFVYGPKELPITFTL
jgi:cytochrome P450